MKNFFSLLIKEVQKKNLILLAASSSFFFTLTIIPFTLLLLSFFNQFIIIDSTPVIKFIDQIRPFIPETILNNIDELIGFSTQLLQSQEKYNYMHYIILIISSLGFFGSVWRSIELISDIEVPAKMLNKAKSFLSIAASIVIILSLTFIPFFVQLIIDFLKSDFASYVRLDRLLDYTNGSQIFFILGQILLLSCFYLFFKYFFKRGISHKSAILGSLFFSFGLILSKQIFFLYIELTKYSLIFKFGALYSILIFLFWIYLVLLLFYLSLTLTLVFNQYQLKRLSLNDLASDDK